MSAPAREVAGVSAAAEVGATGTVFPTKRLKYVVALRRLRTSAGDAARPYVGLEDIESGTGRLANGPRGKRGSSPPAPSVTDGDFSSLSRDSARYPSSPPAPSVTDGDGEPGRCFHQNAGGSSPSAPSVTDGNEATGADFEPGDVLFGKLRPYLAKAWVAEFPGRCTTEALVMEPTSIEPRFLRSVCLSSRFVSDVDASTFGSKMPRAEWDFIGNMPVPVPDADTQRNIADHLDRETARLDALVAAKERLLKLLAEKRRAVVTRAVTRGLDPSAPLRDSGVSWLGGIPAHWRLTRLKFVADVRGGLALGKDYGFSELEEYSYVRVANVQDGYLSLDEVKTVQIPKREAENYLLQTGDVLMNEGGDDDKLGRGCIWNGEVTPCLHQNHVFAVRPRLVEPEWIDTWASSDVARFHFELYAKRTTNLASISAANLKELPLLLPSAEERREILRRCAGLVERFVTARSEIVSTVALLKERRAALIAAAVIGRLDVGRTPCR